MWPFKLWLRNGLQIIYDTLLKLNLGSKHFVSPRGKHEYKHKTPKIKHKTFIFF